MKKKKQLRAQLRKIVRSTPFQKQDKVREIELIVLRAIELIQSYQRPAWVMSSQVMQNPSLRKARGRPNQTPYRILLSAAIFRAWQIGQGEKPIVNKRLPGAMPSPFVAFATKIYHLLYVQNTIDNLDMYRSLGNRLERDHFTQQMVQ